jgi:hypothetical protein
MTGFLYRPDTGLLLRNTPTAIFLSVSFSSKVNKASEAYPFLLCVFLPCQLGYTPD